MRYAWGAGDRSAGTKSYQKLSNRMNNINLHARQTNETAEIM